MYGSLSYTSYCFLFSWSTCTYIIMEDLERIFNHVVLPPKLPDGQDPDINILERVLMQRLEDAAETLRETTTPSFNNSWTVLRSSLQVCRILNNGTPDRLELKAALKTLLKEQNRVLVCHVVEQNAALLVHRQTEYAFPLSRTLHFSR